MLEMQDVSGMPMKSLLLLLFIVDILQADGNQIRYLGEDSSLTSI